MSKHSPGKWAHYQNGSDIDLYAGRTPIGRMHSVLSKDEPARSEYVANARLITAAPDLLAAAEAALLVLLKNNTGVDHEVIESLRAAIDKSNGIYPKGDEFTMPMSPEAESDFAVGKFFEIPSEPKDIIVKIATIAPNNGTIGVIFDNTSSVFPFSHKKTKSWKPRKDLIDFPASINDPVIQNIDSKRMSPGK